MGTLNCPNQYKVPGGRAFDELFDAWTLDTTIVDRCFCQILRNIYNYWGRQSHTKYIIILTGLRFLSYPIDHDSNPKPKPNPMRKHVLCTESGVATGTAPPS